MPTLFRIATVKATGKKYLVQFIDFRTNKVTCWGEVVARKGLKTTHGPHKSFMLDFVDISPEQAKTETFVRELTTQMLDGLREEGKLLEVRTTRSGNTIYRTR